MLGEIGADTFFEIIRNCDVSIFEHGDRFLDCLLVDLLKVDLKAVNSAS